MATRTTKAITLTRDSSRHLDVIQAADFLAQGDYGSAANALVVMVRQSPLFQEAITALRSDRPARAGQPDAA